MEPGLQWACLGPCTSSAVVPLPDTDLIRLYLACIPSACPQCVLWHGKAGSPAGCLAKVQLPQLITSLRCQLGNHPTVVTVWHTGVLAGWHLLNSASCAGVSYPLNLKRVIISFSCASFGKLRTTPYAVFLVLTFLKLAWNCLVNLWDVIDTFTDPLSLGKGLKIWRCTGLSHLSLLY